MKDVEVQKVNGKTEVTIAPFKMKIRFDAKNLEIAFEGAKNNTIALSGNTQFLFGGDTYLVSNGEFGVITNGQDIHLDSIDANVHLNSRLVRPIRDLPESIEYRERVKREQEEKREQMESQLSRLVEELTTNMVLLEERIKELEHGD